MLFHDDRIQKRCAIVTDLDACFFDTAPKSADSDPVAKQKAKAANAASVDIARQARLNAFAKGNAWLSTHYAPCTFEVEFIRSGNAEIAVGSLGEVYTNAATIQQATDDLRSADPVRFGRFFPTITRTRFNGRFMASLSKVRRRLDAPGSRKCA